MDESTVKQENVTEFLVKFALLAILIEKNLLEQRKHKNENIRNW